MRIPRPSKSDQPSKKPAFEPADSQWKNLYTIGGATALAAVGFEIVAVLIGVISTAPTPSTVIGWFTLLQNNRFLGLKDLGLFDIIALSLLIPMFSAVYLALRRASQAIVAVATAFSFVGIVVYLATQTAFSMLSLSDQYAIATTDAQRSMLLAAGQAMLADQIGVGAGTYMALFFLGVAGLIISAIMLRSEIFGKITASVGILANVITLAFYLGLAFVSTSLPLGVDLYYVSGLLSLIWYFQIGRRLYQMGRLER